MKKTYINPALSIVNVEFRQHLLGGSQLNIDGSQTAGESSGGFTKGDNSWDVWDDDDFRDE